MSLLLNNHFVSVSRHPHATSRRADQPQRAGRGGGGGAAKGGPLARPSRPDPPGEGGARASRQRRRSPSGGPGRSPARRARGRGGGPREARRGERKAGAERGPERSPARAGAGRPAPTRRAARARRRTGGGRRGRPNAGGAESPRRGGKRGEERPAPERRAAGKPRSPARATHAGPSGKRASRQRRRSAGRGSRPGADIENPPHTKEVPPQNAAGHGPWNGGQGPSLPRPVRCTTRFSSWKFARKQARPARWGGYAPASAGGPLARQTSAGDGGGFLGGVLRHPPRGDV